jgi:hypothetical protein
MRELVFCLAAAFAALPLSAQSEPQPRAVEPAAQTGQPPADAVVLFDGKDLSQFSGPEGKPAGCSVADGAIVCETGSGDLVSRAKFRDAQIHMEWLSPSMPGCHGQDCGNSGVFFPGYNEIQILDSYRNPTYPDGSCGALYRQAAPLVNASRPPGQWQSYDIVFHPPQCSVEGKLLARGNITVFHNGILVQDHTVIHHIGRGCIEGEIGKPGPIVLQDHSYSGGPFTVMRFRNIWYRPLEEGE